MGIDNPIEKTTDNRKPTPEKVESFTADEKKLIDEFNANKSNRYKIDLLNLATETGKIGGKEERNDFFEKNYKKISKDSQRYPTLSTLLQTFLTNNKQSVNSAFTENFYAMEGAFSSDEIKISQEIYTSPTMQTWFDKNPEKNKRIAWNQFNELFCDRVLEWIDQEDWDKFATYPNILKGVVEELYYAAEHGINSGESIDKVPK